MENAKNKRITRSRGLIVALHDLTMRMALYINILRVRRDSGDAARTGKNEIAKRQHPATSLQTNKIYREKSGPGYRRTNI